MIKVVNILISYFKLPGMILSAEVFMLLLSASSEMLGYCIPLSAPRLSQFISDVYLAFDIT